MTVTLGIASAPWFAVGYYKQIYPDRYHWPDWLTETHYLDWITYAIFWPVPFLGMTLPFWIGHYFGRRAKRKIEAEKERAKWLAKSID